MNDIARTLNPKTPEAEKTLPYMTICIVFHLSPNLGFHQQSRFLNRTVFSLKRLRMGLRLRVQGLGFKVEALE